MESYLLICHKYCIHLIVHFLQNTNIRLDNDVGNVQILGRKRCDIEAQVLSGEGRGGKGREGEWKEEE